MSSTVRGAAVSLLDQRRPEVTLLLRVSLLLGIVIGIAFGLLI